MNLVRAATSYILIFALAGCIDRIQFPLGDDTVRFVIDGFISTDPPPYKVEVSESVVLDDPFTVFKPRTLKSMLLMDDLGNVDTLKENGPTIGKFYTPEDGMRGTPGRAYKLRFETLDGRTYESVFDTLQAPSGQIDSIYRSFEKKSDIEGNIVYGWDISFDASIPDTKSFNFWRFTTTYKVETDPKNHREPCSGVAADCPPNSANCGCLAPLPCSGYQPGDLYPDIVYVGPCTCCSCWVSVTNDLPIVQDSRLFGLRNHVVADFIPLTPYNFMSKSSVVIEQFTVSAPAYRFYNAIKNQQTARSSLFQPITGKLPGNIVQISGREVPSEGMFFATSLTSKFIFIDRNEIPNKLLIPEIDDAIFANKKINNSCLDFPNSTNIKPYYWKD